MLRLLLTLLSATTLVAVPPPGTIITVAGGGSESAERVLGQPATNARLSGPNSLAVGPDNQLYFTINEFGRLILDIHTDRIWRLSPDGLLELVSQQGVVDGQDMAFAPDGSLYLADDHGTAFFAQGRIVRLLTDGQLENVTDSGVFYPGMFLRQPRGLAVGHDGSVYVSDQYRQQIYRVDPNPPGRGHYIPVIGNGLISQYTLTGTLGSLSGDNGPALQAGLDQPRGLAIDQAGNLYIADGRNKRIRKVDAATGHISTIAAFSTEPNDVLVAPDGTLFITDQTTVWRRSPDQIITPIAGLDFPGSSGDGGPSDQARLSNPRRLALDRQSNLFIADSGNNRIREIIQALPSGVAPAVRGDVNSDGQLTITDVMLALRAVVGLQPLTPAQLKRADLDASGTLTLGDVTRLLRLAIGLNG